MASFRSFLILALVAGHITGPDVVCLVNDAAMPASTHGAMQASTGGLSITYSPASGYTPGTALNIGISGGTGWKGIVMYVKNEAATKIGSWTPITGTKASTTCLPALSTLVHTDNTLKITPAAFIPPAGTAGNLLVEAMVLTSQPVWYSLSVTVPAAPPTASGTTLAPTASTPPTPAGTAPAPAPAPAPASAPSQYDSGNGLFKLSWSLNSDSTIITFTMTSSRTSGWISLGLAPQGTQVAHAKMECWTGYYDQTTNKAKLYLGYSSQQSICSPNTELSGSPQYAVSGVLAGGSVSLTWTRPMDNTAAEPQSVVIGNFLQTTFWAVAPTLDTTQIHDTTMNLPLINFFTGAIEQQGHTSGWLLCTLVFTFLALYTLIRWTRRILKNRRRQKLVDGLLADNLPQKGDDATTTSTGKGDNQVRASVLGREPPRAAASRFFMQGGERVAYKPKVETLSEVEVEMEVGEMADPPSPTSPATDTNAPVAAVALAEKERGRTVVLRGKAALGFRVPKIDESVSVILVWAIYLGVNIGCLCYGTQSIADRLGSVAVANALLIVIPSSRNGMLSWCLGLAFDRVVVFHRWLGRWTMLLVLAHMIAYWDTWFKLDKFTSINANGFRNKGNFLGWWAAVAGLWIIITSLYVIRRKKFEFFFWAHFVFILFYVFTYMHAEPCRIYVIFAAIIFFLDRLIRFMLGFFPVRSTTLRVKDGNIMQVRFPKNVVADLLGMYKVGQYVFLNFPQLSLVEWHPFSVSSGPREISGEVHIRGLGDHTKKLVEFAKSQGQIWVRVDGPYGDHRLNYRRYPVLLLVAGGIGITPVIGILKDLFSVGHMLDKSIVPGVIKAVHIVWVMKKEEEYLWFKEEISQCMARQGAEGFPNLILHLYASTKKGAAGGGGGEAPLAGVVGFQAGRPDFARVFDQIGESHEHQACVVFACGPAAMVHDCWDNAVTRTGHGVRYDFHHETFEF